MQFIINYIAEYFTWFFIPIEPGTYDPVQQAWLPVAVGIASLLAKGYGMYKKSRADKKLQQGQEGINRKYNDLASWYNNESSKDFMDTSLAQSSLSDIKDQVRNQLNTNNSNAVKTGATAEAKVAAQGELSGRYNDAVRNLSKYGTQYQNNMKRDYKGMLTGMSGMNAATYLPASQSWGNFIGNADQMGSSAIQAMGKNGIDNSNEIPNRKYP